MSEFVYQPTEVLEDEAYLEQDANEAGRLQRFVQQQGRRAGAVVLAGSAAFGLTGCDPHTQTFEHGWAKPEKVLSIGENSIQTGLCKQTSQRVRVGDREVTNKSHNCTPQAYELKGQTVAQVRDASNDFGGNIHNFSVFKKTTESCKGPGKSFVNTLKPGDVIKRHSKTTKHFNDKGREESKRDFCTWTKG